MKKPELKMAVSDKIYSEKIHISSICATITNKTIS